MTRSCVFTSAGDRNAVRQWLPADASRHFDLLIAFYGDDEARFEELRAVATRIWRIKGGKMQNLHALVQGGQIDLSAYDQVWLPDDDVLIAPADIPRLFGLAAAYDLWVCQPAFVGGSRAAFPLMMTAATRDQVRLVTFVEGTCPLFRRDRLEAFLAAYDGSLVGRGIDWWFAHVLGARWSGRFAVIDAITACNPRIRAPGTIGEIDRLQPAEARRDAWHALRQARRIPQPPPQVLATLPLPPGWAASAPIAAPKPVFGRLAMTPREADAFRAALAPTHGCYLEWGLGGSTREALHAPARRIVSVEGDAGWIALARADADVQAGERSGRLSILHADIGPTGPWGVPKTRDDALWAGYAERPWAMLAAEGAWPEIVLVDGRFRVACACAVAREALHRPGLPTPRLLLHDVGPERPHYGPVFEAWETESSAGTLHLLRLRPGLDAGELERMVARFGTDPR